MNNDIKTYILLGVIILLVIYIIILHITAGRRRAKADNIGTGGLEQRAEDDIAAARADNQAAGEQNKQLGSNNERAGELIQRAEEILGIKHDNR